MSVQTEVNKGIIEFSCQSAIFCRCGRCLDKDRSVVVDCTARGKTSTRAFCSMDCDLVGHLIKQVPMMREVCGSVAFTIITPDGQKTAY